MKQSVLIAIAITGVCAFVGIGFLIGYNVRSALVYVNVVDADVSRAVCKFPEGGDVNGTVFIQESTHDDAVFVSGELNGRSDGPHGFHVHKLGNLGSDCVEASGHFNPFAKQHGAPTDSDRHVGDLGNIDFFHGHVRFNVTDYQVKLRGPVSVVGRAIVVHAKEDDLGRGMATDSKKTGDAGPRIACCVIGIDAIRGGGR